MVLLYGIGNLLSHLLWYRMATCRMLSFVVIKKARNNKAFNNISVVGNQLATQSG